MRKFKVTWLSGLLLLAVCLTIAVGLRFGGDIDDLPFVACGETSIGIYSGRTPFDLAPAANTVNPVIQPNEVSDSPARGVSDPFMVFNQGLWYMFFEVVHARTNQGNIGFATSGNGYYWSYQRIVLDEPSDLSYPCVFEWKGGYYMVPESKGDSAVFLYEATPFPSDWTRLTAIINEPAVAPTFFAYHDTCWIFLGTEDHADLMLYYAADVLGPWTRHPQSPVVSSDSRIATPAGRVTECNGRLYRFALDCSPDYDNCIRVFEIYELTGATYKESEISQSPILSGSGEGWNADRMQHVDPHQLDDGSWIACVDGTRDKLQIGLKY
jgi:hypothetical protein